MERAAAAGLAVDPDAAVHQVDQPRGDGQAKSRAAEAPRRRRVGLFEHLENRPLFVWWDADAGVTHGHVQDDIVSESEGTAHRPRIAGGTQNRDPPAAGLCRRRG